MTKAKLVLAVLLTGLAMILTQWTTLSSIPRFSVGGAASFGGTVFAAVSSKAYTLDVVSGIWTTVSSRPITSYKALVGALSGQRAIVAGGDPGVAAVHVFDMQTGTWTGKANLPIGVRSGAAGCDGQRFWVAAGYAPPSGIRSELQEYDSDADAWTSKTSLPLAIYDVCGAYSDGAFIVGGYGFSWIFVYYVAPDVWTTGASLPSARGGLFGGVAAIAGFGFVVGGNSNNQKLERYDIGNNVWTTLDPIPKPSWGTATAITSAGLLVAIGNNPGIPYVHGYTIGYPASPAGASGDPLFHTFTGPPVHLSLGTAVFNFLTTPTVVVNALVEEFPSLPPEENTVVTTLGVLSEVNGCLLLLYCSVANGNHFCALNDADKGTPLELGNILTPLEYGFRVSLGGLSLEIHLVSQLIEFVSQDAVTLFNSTFINLWVHPAPPHFTSPAVFGGIIGDMCSFGLPHVLAGLVDDAYTVADGCLFATEVKATAGVFSLQASGMAADAS